MAIDFKEKIDIKPVDTTIVAALRLEAQLNKHFPAPLFDGSIDLDSTEWRLSDSADSRSIGPTVTEVFEEMREHDLQPDSLFHTRRVTALREGERGPLLRVYFAVKYGDIHLTLEGTNRMAVDGAAATCHRIKRALEKPAEPEEESKLVPVQPTLPAPLLDQGPAAGSDSSTVINAPLSSTNWLANTWKDHTAQFVVTLVAGVLVVAIALWLGLSPKP